MAELGAKYRVEATHANQVAALALAQIQQEGPPPPRLLVAQLKRSHQSAVAQLERVWPRLDNPALLLRVRRALGK